MSRGPTRAGALSPERLPERGLCTSHKTRLIRIGLSDVVGDREFVIDTSRNGLGPPPDDPHRDDEWCNPAQQGLGTQPTVHTGLDRVAAQLWIKRPGESDGLCGGENTYGFSPTQASNLIAHAGWVPETVRAQAEAAAPESIE